MTLIQNLPVDADDVWPIVMEAEKLVHSGRMRDVAVLYKGLLDSIHESGNSRIVRKLGEMLRRHRKLEEVIVHCVDLGVG